MNKTWMYFHKDTGVLYAGRSSLPRGVSPASMAPPDHLPIELDCDWNTTRINLETMQPEPCAAPAPDRAASEHKGRAHRDWLLSQCDWVVTKAVEAGRAVPADWLAYRQALRDLTEQAGFPFEVIWPTAPDHTPARAGTEVPPRGNP